MEKESLIKRYLRVESEYSAYLGNMDIYHQYADGTDSALAYPG